MSTRKLSGRLNTNSPISVASTDSNNTLSSTSLVSQSPTKTSPTSTDALSQSTKDNSTGLVTNSSLTQLEVKKRQRRRTSVLASPSTVKKSDENDETASINDAVVGDDEKSIKNATNDEEIKDDKESVAESPARLRRRKLYENKTPTTSATTSMMTRKSTTMDCVRNTRSLRCIRRDSQGKLEGVYEVSAPKRPYRRKTNSTPELSTPTKRKKDEMGKDEDDSSLLQKKIKIEKIDPDDEIEKIEDEDYVKEDDDEEKSFLEDTTTIKTETMDDAVMLVEADSDGILNESISEDNTESHDQAAVTEKSDENADDTSSAASPPKEVRARGRPKKGKRSKPPIERKIQPRRSVTLKKGRKSVDEIADDSEKKEMKTEELEETKETTATAVGVEEPLVVDTNIEITTEKELPSNTSGGETSEKATSLSPDLVSEGVNVQSVKDFYKKPEFLENNRGIEKDPKLGGIVKNSEENVTEKAEEENPIVGNKDNESEKIPEIACENSNESPKTYDEKEGDKNEDKSKKSVDENSAKANTSCSNEDDHKSVLNDEKDVIDTSGKEDSCKDDEITLVLEDSLEDVENENKNKEENEAVDVNNKPKENVINTVKDDIVTDSVTSITKENEEMEVDDDPQPMICDKNDSNSVMITINEKNAKMKSNVIDKNNDTSDSNNSDKICSSNRAVEDVEAFVIGVKILKDIIDVDNIGKNIKNKDNSDNNLELKAIENKIAKEEVENDEEKLGTKDQLHLQMEVDSGISDAITEPFEDASMHETKHEEKTDTENDENELKTTINIKESNKKSVKKSKEERDLKKTDKMETELPLNETPENLKQKEDHLKTLGLLTHKAAVEAKNEKQRRRKQLQSNLINSLTTKKNGNNSGSCSNSSSNSSISSIENNNGRNSNNDGTGIIESGGNGGGSRQYLLGNNYNKNSSEEYTGTLKTVIKLNRQLNTANAISDTKRKSIGNNNCNNNNNNGNGNGIMNISNNYNNNNNSSIAIASTSSGISSIGIEGRQSLKMTFQKGRGRPPNSQKDAKDSNNFGEETYYTIQSENEGLQHQSVTHGRKSYNRFHTTTTTVDVSHTTSLTATSTTEITTAATTVSSADQLSLPLSKDQQSSDKIQEKEIVLIPEKASSFGIHPGRLCQDQCFYCGGRFGLYDTPCHVAQLKSEERKQKILANEEKLTIDNCLCDACFRHVVRRAKDSSYKPRISAPAALETTSSSSSTNTNNNNTTTQDDIPEVIVQDDVTIIDETPPPSTIWTNLTKGECFVPDCKSKSSHSLRRKCIRKTIKKLIPNFDLSKIGTTAPICEKHYNAIIQFLGCALCKRRLGKNHMQYINQDSERLGKLLEEQGIPVKLANNSAVCKLCRYFVNLLLKPPDHGKLQKEQFVKNYRRRLLHFHNIQSDEISDTEEQTSEIKNDNSSNEKKDKSSVEEVTIVKSRRGRKPKNQMLTGNVGSTITVTESDKSSSNVGTGSNSPQSSDEGNEKLLQPVTINTNPISGQIILDNDVMVDYDMPVPLDTPSPPAVISRSPSTSSVPPSQQQQQLPQKQSSIASKLQSILQNAAAGGGSSSSSSSTSKEDISIVLRSNPNISMRELFPGEEEMGLQLNIPFGSSQSYRTPEGWTRVQTFLQYDEPTRRLWENLQKPYGNQSSFLRHLILLEKYFRNGDLILSHNASENASVYSETIRNRLRSYDNTCNNSKINSSDNGDIVVDMTKSLLDKIPKHVSNLPITITTKPKQQSQSASNINNNNNTNNNNNNNNNNNINGSSSSTNDSFSNNSGNNKSRKSSAPLAGDSILKSNLLGKKSDSVEILPISSSDAGMTKQQKLLAAATKLMGNGEGNSNQQQQQQQQLTDPKKAMLNNGINLPPQLISINRGQNNLNAGNTSSTNRSKSGDHHMHHRRKQIPPNVIVLPDTLTPTERLQSKNWRPTLMPVSQAGHLRQQGGPLYQTADGRRLPALVQVQSGGQPYLISIHDYNRMCILRREKMREQLLKNRNLNQQFVTQQNKSHQYVGGGRHSDPSTSGISGGGGSLLNNNRSSSSQHHSKTSPQQTSLLKSSLASGPVAAGIGNNNQLASKLLGASSQLQIVPQMSGAQLQPQQLNPTSTNNSVSIIPSSLASSGIGGTLLPPPSTLATNSPASWLWNNINGAIGNNPVIPNKNLMPFNTNPVPSTSTSSSISPLKQQHQHFPLQQQHCNVPLILDNNLLSKIPKSLTVIPQQKPHGSGRSRGSSIDDLNSA